MADTLKEILLDSSRRPAVVTDLRDLVDAEVSDKGGVSGAVVKTGFAAVKKIKPGIIPSAVDTLLPTSPPRSSRSTATTAPRAATTSVPT